MQALLFFINLHNYCPTCRESGKGDDLCVTNQAPCNICTDLSAEQHAKIKNRRRYTRKQKSDVNTSKNDPDLLGDDEESFTGSQADLEGAADNYVHPAGGWTYYFCFFRRPASHLVSRHFRQQFSSYLYQILHAGLLG